MYLLGAILCIVLIGWWYTRRKRNQREAQLMERIRELMQSVKSITEDRSVSVPKDTSDESLANKEQEDTDTLSEDDRLFIQKATALVEQNINSMHGYNVDELARDMAMERTGLYRHLTRIIKQSPSAFIHGIRMERADNLLRTTNMSITDIAEKLGFSTPSYFTKCYKSYYGVKPSEIQRDNQ
jgi:AraC-like DNA-binding protein